MLLFFLSSQVLWNYINGMQIVKFGLLLTKRDQYT